MLLMESNTKDFVELGPNEAFDAQLLMFGPFI